MKIELPVPPLWGPPSLVAMRGSTEGGESAVSTAVRPEGVGAYQVITRKGAPCMCLQLLEFDKELSVFKDRLCELDISFPPSYPYSEDSSQGEQYMNTRCPAWCDRILMSPSAKELVLKSESEEKVVTYDHIGPNVCMGDHKPVFLAFRIAPGAGKRCQRSERILRQTAL
ncbi:PREDICTED: type I inositol 1,4,5-trisphosphate 5-phosphatase-like [Galeopterus variegatus]|uniref:inositol-polyphosphate 5-phosphatase n=1 Tax=Galeopterus variegatus TaxID=482537 RepID=A0ABM0RL80_GALVR|nr:PREDICTED: type I inositol 1,4,5-trisphosphate 5-phosphatase-like [Galeopterus variegatus]